MSARNFIRNFVEAFTVGDELDFQGRTCIAKALKNGGTFYVGAGTSDADITYRHYLGSATKYWELNPTNSDLILSDNVGLAFGTGSDVTFAYSGTALNTTGTSQIWNITGVSPVVDAAGVYLTDDTKLTFGTGSDLVMEWNGTGLLCYPKTTDTGYVTFGANSKYVDVYFYVTGTSYGQFDIGSAVFKLNNLNMTLEGSAAVVDKVASKNAAAVTLDADDIGGYVYNSYSSGAATLTLPAPSATYTGQSVHILNNVDQNLTIDCASTDKISILNDLSADSITFSTAGELLGASAHFHCTGSRWFLVNTVGTYSSAT